MDSEQGFHGGCPDQQAVDQTPAAVDNLGRYLDQILAERTEVHTDNALLVGLPFFSRHRRAGLGDRQPQPALQVPRQVAIPIQASLLTRSWSGADSTPIYFSWAMIFS